MISSAAALGDRAHVAAVLAGAFAGVQVTPMVWTAWRTALPCGVATATWVLNAVEGGP